MSELLSFILAHETPFQSQSRLVSLYSDFANLKSTNPDGYRANISAWNSAIQHAAKEGILPGDGLLTFIAGPELEAQLEAKGFGSPAALGTVLGEAVAKKDMFPLDEFLSAQQSILETRWLPQITAPSPWQILLWSLRKLGFNYDRHFGRSYVVMANVEAAAKYILSTVHNSHPTSASLTYSLQTFVHRFGDILSPKSHEKDPKLLSASDISVLLAYLSRDTHKASVQTILSESGDPFTVVKFSSSTKARPQPISDADAAIARLHTLVLNLNTQISTFTDRITHLDRAAREAICATPEQRSRALAALRAKKVAETNLAKRNANLEQVEGVLSSIEDAQGHVEMVRAMEASGRVLKELHAQVGGMEKVEKVMDDLMERMSNVEDINRILAEGGTEGVDETEIDEDLAALEKEHEDKEKAQRDAADETRTEELLESAPSVPQNLPDKHNDDVQQQVSERLNRISLDEPNV